MDILLVGRYHTLNKNIVGISCSACVHGINRKKKSNSTDSQNKTCYRDTLCNFGCKKMYNFEKISNYIIRNKTEIAELFNKLKPNETENTVKSKKSKWICFLTFHIFSSLKSKQTY